MTISAEVRTALHRCFEALPNNAITLDEYRWWRSALTDPFSVPTALSIGRTAADFAEACDHAGVPYNRATFKHAPRSNQRHRWTKTEVSDVLQACAAALERTPTIPEYKAWRLGLEDPSRAPSIRLLERRGWQTQIALAGLPARTFLGDEDLRHRFETTLEELGSGATQSAFDRYRAINPALALPSSTTMMRRTGKTWRQLVDRNYSQARPSLSRSRS